MVTMMIASNIEKESGLLSDDLQLRLCPGWIFAEQDGAKEATMKIEHGSLVTIIGKAGVITVDLKKMLDNFY